MILLCYFRYLSRKVFVSRWRCWQSTSPIPQRHPMPILRHWVPLLDSVCHQAGIFRQGHQESLGFDVAGEVCQLVAKQGLSQGEFGLLCGVGMVDMALMLKKSLLCETLGQSASLFYVGSCFAITLMEMMASEAREGLNSSVGDVMKCLIDMLPTHEKYLFLVGKFRGSGMFII